MSLMEELLAQHTSPQERLTQLAPFMQQQQPQSLMDVANPNSYQGNLPPQDLATEIARKIENKGFQVSGLEGFQGTGQISTGHIDNSQHYSGMAGDVTGGSGNRDLSWLNDWLQRRYGDQLTELLWQVPDHYNHLHYGTRPGG